MNNKIKTAGGIVLKNDKILFIYKRGRWDLPKGKVEEGPSIRKTAKIEISEETGLPKNQLKILKKLIPTHYHKTVDGEVVVKKTEWFLIIFQGDESTPLIPDRNEGITECKWFTFDELVLVLEESHERIRYLIEFFLNTPYYKKYLSKLNKK